LRKHVVSTQEGPVRGGIIEASKLLANRAIPSRRAREKRGLHWHAVVTRVSSDMATWGVGSLVGW